jgi:hypothetical protein
MTTIDKGSKVKLTKDHNGKPLNRPKYGYVVAVAWCEDAFDGFICTEKGFQKQGEAYLVQTSWGGGALWYSHLAIMPAKGIYRLGEWQKALENYHLKHG